jgi:hypothetical protein
LPAHVTYDEPVSSLDIVATVAAAAGVALPADRVYDGLDIIPYLAGEQVSPERTLCWRWFGLGPDGPPDSLNTLWAIRSGPLKLVAEENTVDRGLPPALYNLPNDIGEHQDLAATQPEDVDSLKTLYDQWNTELISPLWWIPQGDFQFTILVLAGDWNGFDKRDSTEPWRLTWISAPAVDGTPDAFQWFKNTVHVAATGGDTTPGIHTFAVVGNNNYQKQWGGVTINIDDVAVLPFFSGSQLGPTNTISLEDGFYYSFRILAQLYPATGGVNPNRLLAVMKTSAPPVSVSLGGKTPSAPTSNDPVVVSIVASQLPSVQEQIYLRWSSDTFVTSHMVSAVPGGDGVSYSTTIPAQPAGTSVEYCITTSTVDLTQVSGAGIIDSLTLATSPHSHYVVTPGGTPTATPSPTATPTSPPTAAPPPTPVLSGLTYGGGTPFVDGTNLMPGTSYTITARASSNRNRCREGDCHPGRRCRGDDPGSN